tara:strand:- start:71 stop:1141 length:1071 start_codon:yes stop_codon:yes gene_type:complete
MRWIKNIFFYILTLLLILIFFLITELSYRMILGKLDLTVLYEYGDNFKNYDNFVKYEPNKTIRSVALSSKQFPKKISDVFLVYDYEFSTNNAGLVMGENLKKDDQVYFILGDSFTEGQGSEPWFYDLEIDFNSKNTSVVNLGILGTGPEQWSSLKTHIEKLFKLDSKGMVINIIPNDILRRPWTFKKKEIKCLKYADCDYNFHLQGFKFSEKMNQTEIKLNVLKDINERKFYFFNSGDFIKETLKSSKIIIDLYNIYKTFIFSDQEIKNQTALLNFKKQADGNVFINVISQKEINSNNYRKYRYASELIEFLEQNSFSYSWCNIPLEGFYEMDTHPNIKGYEKVKSCTYEALKRLK